MKPAILKEYSIYYIAMYYNSLPAILIAILRAKKHSFQLVVLKFTSIIHEPKPLSEPIKRVLKCR